ncbi:MAG: hypothetical protein KAH21_01955 [Spirochaetaceae bacterium]|nr:hypothetical protein [Spirochaetaceae bacterium]
MKIVEQYLKAVGSNLSWNSRKDITEELRSLLMDQIEADYGLEPNEKEVKEAITKFGSPSQVADRYRSGRQVISPGLTELYFMIMAIMAGAMLLAFSTVFIVEALQHMPAGRQLIKGILMIFANTLGGWLSGVGALTLSFIILSRFIKRSINIDEGWTVEDLKDVTMGTKPESRVESIFTIVFLFILIVLMNLYPSILTLGENLFTRSGLMLGHRVVIEVFRRYIGVLTILWAAGIVFRVTTLHKGEKGKGLMLGELGLSGAEVLLSGIMLFDSRLYYDVHGWIGFKVIFVIILVVNLFEIGSGVFRMVRERVVEA